MSYKPKTRAYARIDGVKRELFRVRELTDKSLTIISSHPKYWFDKNDKRYLLKEQHYSVHKPHDGIDTQITKKTFLEDGQPVSNTAFIHNTKDYLCWPVYARRFPHFDSRTFYSRPRDHSFKVAQFSFDKSTLFYSVFVTRPDFYVNPDTVGPANMAIIPFEELSLIVLTAYINLRTMIEGDIVGMATSPEVSGGVITQDHFQLYTESIAKDNFVGEHWRLMTYLRDAMRRRLYALFHNEPSIWNFILGRSELFTKTSLK